MRAHVLFSAKSGFSFSDSIQTNVSRHHTHGFSLKRCINQCTVSCHCYWCDKYFIRRTKRLLLPTINIPFDCCQLVTTHTSIEQIRTCWMINEKYAKRASQMCFDTFGIRSHSPNNTMRNNNGKKESANKGKNKLHALLRQQFTRKKTNEARTKEQINGVEDKKKASNDVHISFAKALRKLGIYSCVADSFCSSFVVQLRLFLVALFHFTVRFPYYKSVLELLIRRWK